MGLFSFLSPLGSLFGGGGGKKKSDVDRLLESLQPYMNRNKEISDTAFNSSQTDLGTARTNYNDLIDYYTKFLTGSRDEQLKNINAGEITADADNSEQILSSFGVRGGRRAAQLGSATFDRDALINIILQKHREGAGEHLKSISDAFANLGLGELSTALGANQSNPQLLLALQQIKEHEKDRKNALIASIIGAAGSAAGAFAAGG